MMAPKVGVDLQGLLTRAVRDKVEKRARDLLLKKLGGSEAPVSDAGAGAAIDTASEKPADPPQPAEPTEKESTKDLFKRGLRDLLKPAEDGT